MFRTTLFLTAATVALAGAPALAQSTAAAAVATSAVEASQIRYRTATVEGVKIFYREAGPKDAPTLLLLHGFPTSSQMFRDLIPRLADRYHVIAPDYPGYGHSDAPDHKSFAYTFDTYARLVGKLTEQIGVDRYALYVMDYGAPVGFRVATAHPGRVTALIVQNGNAYEEGIAGFWNPIKAYWRTGAGKEREGIRWLTSRKATDWQYSNGVKDMTLVDPDAATVDQALLDRPGNQEIQLDLFYDYRTNLPLYPQWQAWFRRAKPPTLVVWGKNDDIFVAAGAAPYARDIPDAEVHMLDTGHFALETHGHEIAELIRDFMDRKVAR
jgi:pimeloyl-ACP methyl ester carboxylesterase